MGPCIVGMKKPYSSCTAIPKTVYVHYEPDIRPLGADFLE